MATVDQSALGLSGYYTSRYSGEEIDQLLGGKSLVISGVYASLAALQAAFPNGASGAYQISSTRDLYVWNEKTKAWENIGPMQGPQGPTGPTGSAAGFGTISAVVDNAPGVPSVEVSSAGPDTAKEFHFSFHGLKGETGPAGPKGDTGETGIGIQSIERTSGTGAAGTTDTYTITLTDGSPAEFQVYNGADGNGAGDMLKSVYDPQGKSEDIFAYVDEAVKNVKVEVDEAPAEGSENPVSSGGTFAALSTKQDALIGFPGQVVGFGASGAAEAVPGWSNQNLLLNWDFRNPVNRNGKTEYTGMGHTVDRWSNEYANGTIKITNKGIMVEPGASASGLIQLIENFEQLAGKTVTFSLLASNITGSIRIVIGYRDTSNTYTSLVQTDATAPGLYQLTGTFPELDAMGTKPIFVRFYTPSSTDAATISAAKLELGDRQTLARQNEDGEWEIIDPPNYDLQYALCSLYSPSTINTGSNIIGTGEWVGYQHSNPNLLDNWYFADPINQRGQTEYTGAGYTLDRWKLLGSGGKVEIVSDGIILKTVSANCVFSQMFEDAAVLVGKKVTMSFLVDPMQNLSGFQLCRTSKSLFNTGLLPSKCIDSGTGPQLYTISFIVPSDFYGVSFYAYYGAGQAGEIKLMAAKLELGPVQTLAHQDTDGNWVLNDPPPNKTLELAKCQRYFQRIPEVRIRADTIISAYVYFAIPTSGAFRCTPSLTAVARDDTIHWIRSVKNDGLYRLSQCKVIVISSSPSFVVVRFELPQGANVDDCSLLISGYIDLDADL